MIRLPLIFILFSSTSILAQSDISYYSFGKPSRGIDIIETNDSGYLITGNTFDSEANQANAFLLKLDKDGEEQWEKEYIENGTSQFGWSMVGLDNAYIVVGFMTSHDVTKGLLIKTDLDGNVQLRKELDDYPYQIAWSITKTDSGEIMGVGEIQKEGKYNIWIYKLNSEGEFIWQKMIDRGDYSERAFYIDRSGDNTFVVAGTATRSDKSKDDVLVMKFDQQGNVLWKEIIKSSDNRDVGHALKVENEKIKVFGYYQVEGQEYFNPLVLELDQKGNIIKKNKISIPSMDIRCMNGSSESGKTMLTGYGRNVQSDFFKTCVIELNNNHELISIDTVGYRGRNTGYGLRRDSNKHAIITGAIANTEGEHSNVFFYKE